MPRERDELGNCQGLQGGRGKKFRRKFHFLVESYGAEMEEIDLEQYLSLQEINSVALFSRSAN